MFKAMLLIGNACTFNSSSCLWLPRQSSATSTSEHHLTISCSRKAVRCETMASLEGAEEEEDRDAGGEGRDWRREEGMGWMEVR